ncbi:T-box brain protein [Trichinella spiralis]|uniref:T-box brain protein n=1 Tax=Trichinella spiralis TaxID=6334 RepID=A0ABR3KWZ0_TRISP
MFKSCVFIIEILILLFQHHNVQVLRLHYRVCLFHHRCSDFHIFSSFSLSLTDSIKIYAVFFDAFVILLFPVFETTHFRFKILYGAIGAWFPCGKLKTLTLTQIIFCDTVFFEIYPFVSNMMMFKSCRLIVDYICIMAGGMIFTLFQGY